MAANVNKMNKMASFAFTLPISCQICLGKVKEPVICPNQHVFCSGCMETWLHRNKQCPACRVDITRENPCRPVLGGLCEQPEGNSDFSSREMRRARMEMLFKDYEIEMENVQRKNERLTEETRVLHERLTLCAGPERTSANVSCDGDNKRVEQMSQKLHDTTLLYDQLKKEAKKSKEEQRMIQDENGKLRMENKSLRLELGLRSPRKFGRTAMAAMESRMNEYMKEITALKKALNRSDSYIEDLAKQIELLSRPDPLAPHVEADTKKAWLSERETVLGAQLTERGRALRAQYNVSTVEDMDDSMVPIKQEDVTNGDDTFNLELPSPATPGSRTLSRLKLGSNRKNLSEPDTFDTHDSDVSADSPLDLPSPVHGAKKKLRFSENQNSNRGLIKLLEAKPEVLPPLTQEAMRGIAHMEEFWDIAKMRTFSTADTQPSLSHIQPSLAHTQPSLAHIQPSLAHTQPSLAHTQPSLAHTQPSLAHTQPSLAHIQPSLAHTQPSLAYTQPSLAHTKPSLAHTQPSLAHTQPSLAHTQPSLPHTQQLAVLDTSITPEMRDCMQIFAEAELKVEVDHGTATHSTLYRAADRGLNAAEARNTAESRHKPSWFSDPVASSVVPSSDGLYPHSSVANPRALSSTYPGIDSSRSGSYSSLCAPFNSSTEAEQKPFSLGQDRSVLLSQSVAPASDVLRLGAPASDVLRLGAPASDVLRLGAPASDVLRLGAPASDVLRLGAPASDVLRLGAPASDVYTTSTGRTHHY